MIYIYTDKQDSENWILQNDWYFNLYTSNEKFTEQDKAVIWQIDHAKLTADKHIETRYGLGTIRNLSSGCKTLLNVMKHPKKVVNADEMNAARMCWIFFSRQMEFLYICPGQNVFI